MSERTDLSQQHEAFFRLIHILVKRRSQTAAAPPSERRRLRWVSQEPGSSDAIQTPRRRGCVLRCIVVNTQDLNRWDLSRTRVTRACTDGTCRPDDEVLSFCLETKRSSTSSSSQHAGFVSTVQSDESKCLSTAKSECCFVSLSVYCIRSSRIIDPPHMVVAITRLLPLINLNIKVLWGRVERR